MRVFVFGIGGTGARVLRSLTMLLASGVKLKHQNLTIVPIVIDTDAHNGDTARTRDLLRGYYKIRRSFVSKSTTAQSDSFFNTEIRSFKRLDSGTSDAADLDVQFNFQNSDSMFSNFIGYNALSPVNRDLIELLYKDSMDDHPELYLNLSVGFKGNPNIGSVVFNDLMFSPQYKNLEGSFTETDRVFIISSIFGGTGSSGFPTLVKLFRTSKNPNLASSKIGAITVMPYFNVDSSDTSAINSAMFDTKTKAALSFYANDSHLNSINALYYLADNNQSGSLPNVEGGVDQVNNSHLIELIAATAVIDFVQKDNTELDTPHHFEFGAEANASPFTISSFSSETKERCIKPLARFAYAAKIATDFIPTLADKTFYSSKELNIGGELGTPNEYKKILEFFTEFKKWAGAEMNSTNNGRAFHSFDFGGNENVNNLIYGKPIKTGFLSSGLTKGKIGDKLTKAELAEPKDKPLPEKYLAMLYKTASECLDELGTLP